MIIRKSKDSDIPQIIDLLKISLGESMIPKSESLWKWKHVDNPFGKSPVLVAEENGDLVGIRAFLRWEFLENGKVIKACRAVDTATHPKHQGKGVFQKLTKTLIEDIKKEGVQLLFNTPNTKSTPGYLKMGWVKWGKLPLKLNFHMGKPATKLEENKDWEGALALINSIENSQDKNSWVQTKLVPGYISWRYQNNPLFLYQFLSDNENYLLIYRIKEGKMGREFRICDLFTTSILLKGKRDELTDSLTDQIKLSGSRYSSFSGLSYPNQKIVDMGLIPLLKVGPLLTMKPVQDEFLPIELPWALSLGDLEVF